MTVPWGVIAPAHKPKLDNARRGEYPGTAFPVWLMHKDFGLMQDLARVPPR